MSRRTVLISLALHGALGGFTAWNAARPKSHAAVALAVIDQPKKKEEEKKDEKPPPKPIHRPPPTAAPAAATPAAPKSLAPVHTPVRSGLTLSGSGAGAGGTMAVPVGTGGPAPKAPAPKPAEEKVIAAERDEKPECNEAPTKPTPVSRSPIDYPDAARADGVEGRLQLRITVGADGSVTNVEVVSSVQAALDAAAIAIVNTWRFKPAMRCGEPVGGGVYMFAQRFELGD
jgi:protein TonB